MEWRAVIRSGGGLLWRMVQHFSRCVRKTFASPAIPPRLRIRTRCGFEPPSASRHSTAPPTCSKSSVPMGSGSRCEPRAAEITQAFLTWNSRLPLPGRSANRLPSKEAGNVDVLARLPSRRHPAPCALGNHLSRRSLRPAVRLQLLVGIAIAKYRACLDPRQLSRTAAGERLSGNSVSLHGDRSPGYDLLPTARLSPGVLPLVPRRQTKGHALPTGHHSFVGQLPGPGLRVEDDSRHRRRPQHLASVRPP